jgi:endoglucanase
MDNSTLYDRNYYNAALNSGFDVQPQAAVSGGNNSGAIHLSREGVRTVSLSVPSRYIHSSSSAADLGDIDACLKTAEYMLKGICSGEIK